MYLIESLPDAGEWIRSASDGLAAAGDLLKSVYLWLGKNVSLWLPLAVFAWTVAWAMHSWLRGGSVVRVELELGKLDPDGKLVRAVSKKWRRGVPVLEISDTLINPMHVDIAVVTVRNLGRTPSTITKPGLLFGQGRHAVHYGGVLLAPGELSNRVRVEAHDSQEFVFPIAGMAMDARQGVGQGRRGVEPRTIKARAQVTTGTGKVRRSSRRTGWNVEPEGRGVGGGTLTIEAQLFNEHLGQGVDPKELAGEIELVMRLLRNGKSPAEVLSGLAPADEAADFRRSLL